MMIRIKVKSPVALYLQISIPVIKEVMGRGKFFDTFEDGTRRRDILISQIMMYSIPIYILFDPWNLKKGLDFRSEDEPAVLSKINQRFLPESVPSHK
jgi:hypothetical protein